MRRRRTRFIVPAVIILALLGVAGYLVFTPGATDMFRGTTVIEDKATIDTTVIAFVGNPYPDDFGYLRVPGYIDNVSNSEVRAVTLEIQLLDADFNKKEKIETTVEGIPAGGRKTYDINVGVVPVDRQAEIAVVKVEVYK